jgi:hypothetical protein
VVDTAASFDLYHIDWRGRALSPRDNDRYGSLVGRHMDHESFAFAFSLSRDFADKKALRGGFVIARKYSCQDYLFSPLAVG